MIRYGIGNLHQCTLFIYFIFFLSDFAAEV